MAVLLGSFVLVNAAAIGNAQATPTATKSADISVFAGFVSASPDYGPFRNTGGSVGLNFTRYFHLPVAPSLELRANLADGTTVNERTYLFGVRAQADVLGRFHPYADVLAGPGNIHFNFPNGGYTGDNSLVYSYGGGVDADLVRQFQVKIDFQGQHWNTGGSNTYTPTLVLIGLAYRIPFGPHVRQGSVGR